MKKVLLAGTALVGLAFASSPASAEINLDLGGYFRGYGVYSNDESAAASLREFNVRRNAEIHFTGEATTDNGLTVGVHHELRVDDPVDNAGVATDESYMYMSGGWGRFNFGKEDGAAYLLQVAAPSADSNVDGMRAQIEGYDPLFVKFGTALLGLPVDGYDYDHSDFRQNNRLTYLTPKFNGFQGGVSWAPEEDAVGPGSNMLGMTTDDDGDEFDNLWEVAARWDGEFEGFGISFGGGYSHASNENDAASAFWDDDFETWNAGLNVAFQGFSVGAAFVDSNKGFANYDQDTWVVGAAYDNGPYHVGASYFNEDAELAGADVGELDRYTVGGGYTYGPGMSFRGAVAFGEGELNPVSEDFTQVTIGTDVQF